MNALDNYQVFVVIKSEDSGNIIVQTQLALINAYDYPKSTFIFDTAYKFMQTVVHEIDGMALDTVEGYHD